MPQLFDSVTVRLIQTLPEFKGKNVREAVIFYLKMGVNYVSVVNFSLYSDGQSISIMHLGKQNETYYRLQTNVWGKVMFSGWCLSI